MSYATYLSHHGKKGQKWGVQNGPPYPLNDVTKAIAYRGGQMSDGRQVAKFTKRDVRKARRIVDRNLKAMNTEDIKEYKARLLLEKDMGELLQTDTDRLMKNLKNRAIEAAGDSVKQSGTKMLSNFEVNTVGAIVESIFGPDVRNMITDGITKYQAQENKVKKNKDKETMKGATQSRVVSLSGAYNQATDDEIKEVIKNMILENGDYVRSTPKSSSSQPVKDKPSDNYESKNDSIGKTVAPNSRNNNYERVKGEIIDETPRTKREHEYVDKEKVNGEWRYYYEPSYYDSWNSDYLLPGSTNNKSSKKKRKK